jgi:4-amino-4-deoxy-L-arabinose transferase-like glycosyltransferase
MPWPSAASSWCARRSLRWPAELPRLFWIAPALAAVVRLAVLAASPLPPETFEYDELARNVLAGRGYVLEHNGTSYRGYSSGLVYTALSVAFYALGSIGPELLRLAQFAIAAATTVVVIVIAGHFGAGRAALWAGILVATHPALVYYDVRKLHPLGLDALLPAALLGAVLASRYAGVWACAGCGLLLGLASLERLTFLPMLVVAAFWLADGLPWRDRARRLAAFGAATLLTLAPWLVHTHAVFGAPILSTMTAEYFFLGNVPPSSGSLHLPSGARVMDAAPSAMLERLAAADERGQARIFRETSYEFVSREPGRFVAGVLRKLLYFWTWAPQTGVLYPAHYRRVYLALYTVLLAAAISGAWRLRHAAPRAMGLILALCATVSLLQALLYFELRHRWALEPLLVVLALYAVPATSAPRPEAPAVRSGGTGRRSDAGALR